MLKLELSNESDKDIMSDFILDLMNHHRRLNNAPKEYWCTLEEAKDMFTNWVKSGAVYKIENDNTVIGFMYVKHLSTSVSVLEDFYIQSEYRG